MTKYGYIYKCTLIPTGKIYIGKKKSNKFLKFYYGSGVVWNEVIKQYSKSDIQREILQWCNSESELNEAEKYWIDKLNAKDISVGYNISNGVGGIEGERNPSSGKHWYTDGTKSVLCESCPKGYHPGTDDELNSNRNAKLRLKHRTDEQKLHYRQSKLGDKNPMKHMTGKNHPNYGKYIYKSPDGTKSGYFISGEEPTGWVSGMNYKLTKIENRCGINNPAYGKHFYNNGVKEILCKDTDCPQGFIRGRLKRK